MRKGKFKTIPSGTHNKRLNTIIISSVRHQDPRRKPITPVQRSCCSYKDSKQHQFNCGPKAKMCDYPRTKEQPASTILLLQTQPMLLRHTNWRNQLYHKLLEGTLYSCHVRGMVEKSTHHARGDAGSECIAIKRSFFSQNTKKFSRSVTILQRLN